MFRLRCLFFGLFIFTSLGLLYSMPTHEIHREYTVDDREVSIKVWFFDRPTGFISHDSGFSHYEMVCLDGVHEIYLGNSEVDYFIDVAESEIRWAFDIYNNLLNDSTFLRLASETDYVANIEVHIPSLNMTEQIGISSKWSGHTNVVRFRMSNIGYKNSP